MKENSKKAGIHLLEKGKRGIFRVIFSRSGLILVLLAMQVLFLFSIFHWFEAFLPHHTVRTRTQFFTKKGSGTFFVYRRFCGRTTRNGKRAKAGYHYDSGILPFALRNQVRFVRT